MKLLVISVLLVVQQAAGVIYRLNASEYARLPALFALDRYYDCLLAPGDTYCYAEARLVANHTSPLLVVLQEYSAANKTHFDHTLVHRGVCMSTTCRAAAAASAAVSVDLTTAVEACLNDSLYKSHGLLTRVVGSKVWCTAFDEPAGYDAADWALLVAAALLLALVAAGSLLDLCASAAEPTTMGGRVLLCFSLPRNWRRLRAAPGEGPDPRLRRLKCLTGLKAITMMLVIMAHAPLNMAVATSNPDFMENLYHNVAADFLFAGTHVTQTFFVVSAFLLAYNLLVLAERRPLSWRLLPQGVLVRWLRLVPVNAAVLFFVCTWQRHLGAGPLWKSVVGEEARQCRRDWVYNLIYVNNYVDDSDCMPHTWYLGADMQLSVVGLLIFCLARGERARRAAVFAAWALGALAPALHTWLQDLSPIVIVAPEVARTIFVSDATFNNLYKRGHTNLANYAAGLALAMLVYHLQRRNFDITKYKKYRIVYWSLVPAGVLVLLSGVLFYADGVRVPLAARALYAAAAKLLFGLALVLFIGGTIFKFDNVYRGVVEWAGWAAPGRLAYAAFLVHLSVVRVVAGAGAALLYNSFNGIIMSFLAVLCLSFVIATPLWLLLEAPTAQLVKLAFYPDSAPREKNQAVDLFATNLQHKETTKI